MELNFFKTNTCVACVQQKFPGKEIIIFCSHMLTVAKNCYFLTCLLRNRFKISLKYLKSSCIYNTVYKPYPLLKQIPVTFFSFFSRATSVEISEVPCVANEYDHTCDSQTNHLALWIPSFERLVLFLLSLFAF